MKIGILTFHCANNFGAVLQAYALAKYLTSYHEVYIIDYKPIYLLKTTFFFPTLNDYRKNPIKSIKSTIKSILNSNNRLRMLRCFSAFKEKYLPLFEFTDEKKLATFDTIIVGSDQVWNLEITKGFDKYFWGDLIPENVKLISYAASVGRYKFKKNEFPIIRNKISKYSAISVRETNLKELLSNIIPNKKIQLVLDPTFLIDKKIYKEICNKPIYNEKYIVIYEVVHDNNTERIAIKLANELNAPIIQIGSKSKNKRIKSITNIGPAEFINYINYSSFVVTTSFHGTAFSLILNKDFYTIKLGTEIDERAKTLLNSINLSDRHINKTSNPPYTKINYEQVNTALSSIIKVSKDFLHQNL